MLLDPISDEENHRVLIHVGLKDSHQGVVLAGCVRRVLVILETVIVDLVQDGFLVFIINVNCGVPSVSGDVIDVAEVTMDVGGGTVV